MAGARDGKFLFVNFKRELTGAAFKRSDRSRPSEARALYRSAAPCRGRFCKERNGMGNSTGWLLFCRLPIEEVVFDPPHIAQVMLDAIEACAEPGMDDSGTPESGCDKIAAAITGPRFFPANPQTDRRGPSIRKSRGRRCRRPRCKLPW